MSMFRAPQMPSTINPFDPPSARNNYEGFGGGAVGSVGGMNYGNTPWWMLPAGTQSATSFAPSSQMPRVAPGPAPAVAPSNVPSMGGQQDFFSALAGLLSGNKMPGQGFSQGAGAPNAYARPQMKQMSPEIFAMAGNAYGRGTPLMYGQPSSGAMPYTGHRGISEKLRPTEKDPTPWTKTKGWQDPRGNPLARPTTAPAMMPAPGTQPTQRPAGRRQGPGPADFRNWMQQADRQARAQGHTRVGAGTYRDPVSGGTYAM